jgi:ankyrin repeat protein
MSSDSPWTPDSALFHSPPVIARAGILVNESSHEKSRRKEILNAVSCKDLELIQKLVEDPEAILNLATKEKLVHYACKAFDLDWLVVKWMIEKYTPDLNWADIYGMTPVLCAAYMGNFNLVRYLHEDCGCILNQITKKQENIVHLAALNGSI